MPVSPHTPSQISIDPGAPNKTLRSRWRDRLYIEDSREQVLDDICLVLLACIRDVLDLLLGLLARLLLCSLVTLAMLFPPSCQQSVAHVRGQREGNTNLGLELLEFLVLLRLVIVNLLLGFVSGLLDSFRADCD